jgi:hypothetical protein
MWARELIAEYPERMKLRVRKHTRPDNGTRPVFWRSRLAKGIVVFSSSVPLRGAEALPSFLCSSARSSAHQLLRMKRENQSSESGTWNSSRSSGV